MNELNYDIEDYYQIIEPNVYYECKLHSFCLKLNNIIVRYDYALVDTVKETIEIITANKENGEFHSYRFLSTLYYRASKEITIHETIELYPDYSEFKKQDIIKYIIGTDSIFDNKDFNAYVKEFDGILRKNKRESKVMKIMYVDSNKPESIAKYLPVIKTNLLQEMLSIEVSCNSYEHRDIYYSGSVDRDNTFLGIRMEVVLIFIDRF